eukprot:1563479-Rhodomonas_salina.1
MSSTGSCSATCGTSAAYRGMQYAILTQHMVRCDIRVACYAMRGTGLAYEATPAAMTISAAPTLPSCTAARRNQINKNEIFGQFVAGKDLIP